MVEEIPNKTSKVSTSLSFPLKRARRNLYLSFDIDMIYGTIGNINKAADLFLYILSIDVMTRDVHDKSTRPRIVIEIIASYYNLDELL